MNVQDQLDKLLLQVERPGRYIGGELHSVIKDPKSVKLRFGFCFPDSYEIGMSYMGLSILYHLLNKEEDIYCERCFAPAEDMGRLMGAEGLPLFTLETKTPLKEMDMVGFTLQYELCYTNILYMLDLAGIPLLSADRTENDPVIVGGGPCVFNPEPLADFFDYFIVGDGEEVQIKTAKILTEMKAEGRSKAEFLERISHIQGVYVPSLEQEKVVKAFVSDLNSVDFPTETIVPLIEVAHDRSVVEIFRGCTRGCRFCQAGMVYRPVRERDEDKIVEIAAKQLESSGNEELSLLSLSTSDYSSFASLAGKLMGYCRDNHVALSLPSLRMDNLGFKLLDEIQGVRKTGLTFAVEAGTQRLRDVINKNITEQDIMTALDQAMELGWNAVKLYFMIGLPTETYEDLDGIAMLAEKIMNMARDKNAGKKGRFNVSVSVSNFVPKPFTPFQWVPQNTPDEFEQKHIYLREKLKRIKGVTYRYHGSFGSCLEALFARGGRELCAVLLTAYSLGCRFDAWTEGFKEELWKKALEQTGISRDCKALTGFSEDEDLPWDRIDCGVSRKYLLDEWHKALAVKTTPDCRLGCNGCGVNKYTECKLEGSLK